MFRRIIVLVRWYHIVEVCGFRSGTTHLPPITVLKHGFSFVSQDFQFRQMKKTRVFEPAGDLPKERSSLLTLSNKYGLTFVGLDKTFKVYLTKDILAADKVDGNSNVIGMNLTILLLTAHTSTSYLIHNGLKLSSLF